jgi:3-dehydroquinate synthase
VLVRRVARKDNRPLLRGKDPLDTLRTLAEARYPNYAQADIVVETGDTPHSVTVEAILTALRQREEALRNMTTTIPVGLGDRAYDVVVGPRLIDKAGDYCAPFLKRGRTAVITDRNVGDHHGERFAVSLEKAGIAVDMLIVEPGEETKSFEGLADVSDRLLALGLDRGDVIVALGGGVVGDLAGFAASIYKRGIGFIQVPTTLLAQVDSSVGGKTAIDTPRGKNLIGAFHQPRLVLADLDVLATLPAREVACGYAEVVKYGLLGDAAFFAWLEKHGPAVLEREIEALTQAVGRSVEMKAEIVAEDEKEQGRRALLNLGHTFGHALESETGYGEALKHGEGVAAGCALAFRFSHHLGLCSADDAARAEAVFTAAHLPTRLAADARAEHVRRRPDRSHAAGQEGRGRAPDLRAGPRHRRRLHRQGHIFALSRMRSQEPSVPDTDRAITLDDQLCFSLYGASLAINRAYKPLLDALEITYPQYLVLSALWEGGAQSVGGIADRLALESSTVTPLVKRLEQAGFVTRNRNPEDERQVVVSLTDKGTELREKARCLGETLFAAAGMTPGAADPAQQGGPGVPGLGGAVRQRAASDLGAPNDSCQRLDLEEVVRSRFPNCRSRPCGGECNDDDMSRKADVSRVQLMGGGAGLAPSPIGRGLG